MKNSQVYSKSFELSKRIIVVYRKLKRDKEFILSKQLLRSDTSVGANIAEANSAISKKEFSSKMSFAYKEITESIYWIELLHSTEFISESERDFLLPLSNEISKMPCAIIRSCRKFDN